jgi:CheY-like chemotaxis protein
MLSRAGHRVHEAACGDEALTRFTAAGGAYDLVLVDLTMPGVDGASLAEVLRERAPAVPILLMSGFDARNSLGTLLDRPNMGFLQKPFGPGALLTEAERLLLARGSASSASPLG